MLDEKNLNPPQFILLIPRILPKFVLDAGGLLIPPSFVQIADWIEILMLV
jgi:hypothetical protein